jgi:LysM repeat protein
MRDLRQVFWGIVTALISIALLFGGFSLSMAEGNMRLSTSTPLPTITLTLQPLPSQVDSPTPLPAVWTPTLPHISTPVLPATATPSLTPIWTPTLTPSPTNCPPPPGWQPYIVQPGDTLGGLALKVKLSSAEVSLANCLGTNGLLPGQLVYLPPSPSRTPISCGAPHTWVIYIVVQGDTLYHLGQVYGIPYTEIKRANCLTSTIIHIGQSLYVPPWATRTPSQTPIWFYDMPTDTISGETSTPTESSTP